MFKKIKKLIFKEEGQSLVIVALILTVLLGFAAISVDYGYLAYEKRGLQNAADAAALAGAAVISNDTDVKNNVVEYAKANATELATAEIKHSYPNPKEVKVDLSHKYSTFFGRVLGSKSQVITATATAENISSWNGEALPLFNHAFNYANNEDPTAWIKVASGLYGSILNFNGYGKKVSGNKYEDVYFEIDYKNGIEIANGLAKGEDGLNKFIDVKSGLEYLLNNQNKFYLFSLSESVFARNPFYINVIRGNRKIKVYGLDNLKNKDVIDRKEIVLLEVSFNGTWEHNEKNIKLQYTGKSFDLITEFPTEHLSSGGKSSRLIK